MKFVKTSVFKYKYQHINIIATKCRLTSKFPWFSLKDFTYTVLLYSNSERRTRYCALIALTDKIFTQYLNMDYEPLSKHYSFSSYTIQSIQEQCLWMINKKTLQFIHWSY